jgi:hypothetical protein
MHSKSAEGPKDARRQDLARSRPLEDVGPGLARQKARGCVIQTYSAKQWFPLVLSNLLLADDWQRVIFIMEYV